MNKTKEEAIEFVKLFDSKIKNIETSNIYGIAVPDILFSIIKQEETSSKMKLGIQNISAHKSGAFTGDTSANMAKSMGVDFTLIGHSERRTIFHESNEDVKAKINQAITNKIPFILCVGEPLEVRKKNEHNIFVNNQINSAIGDMKLIEEITIAYEPIWAIGTGKVPTVDEIANMVSNIKNTFDSSTKINILYGGSVNPSNVKTILRIQDLSGVLVGGASLDPEKFVELIKLSNN